MSAGKRNDERVTGDFVARAQRRCGKRGLWVGGAVPPMCVAYIAGCRPQSGWEGAALLTADGTPTMEPARAHRFPFKGQDRQEALDAVRRWAVEQCRARDLVPFIGRVLVIGDPAAPDEIVPAWELEGEE